MVAGGGGIKTTENKIHWPHWNSRTLEAEFLDKIQTKVLRVFLLAVHSHLYSFAKSFLFFQTHATSYSFFSMLLYTVKKKGRRPERKSHPLPYGFKKSIQKLLVWRTPKIMFRNLKRNCTFMSSASGIDCSILWVSSV